MLPLAVDQQVRESQMSVDKEDKMYLAPASELPSDIVAHLPAFGHAWLENGQGTVPSAVCWRLSSYDQGNVQYVGFVSLAIRSPSGV